MTAALVAEQLINGMQYGIMLFLISAGLTLTFGILNFINLTHSSFYMLGALFAATAYGFLQNFYLSVVIGVAATLVAAVALDRLALRFLYRRSHLDQVLCTFALLAMLNDLVILLWGPEPRFMAVPRGLDGALEIGNGFTYPLYRIAITAAGLLVALGLYLVIMRTRLGMWIRAGANNPVMLSGIGIDVRLVFSAVFGLGAVMAGFAGMVMGPFVSIQAGMGDELLIVSFVIIVLGGIGSIKGTFFSAIAVGVVDTMGRFLLPMAFGYTIGPALASMAIYILMAAFLVWRPPMLPRNLAH